MSGVYQAVGVTNTALTVVTTSETLLAYSGAVRATFQTVRYRISAWCQILCGTNTTSLVARLRRGNGVTGALVAGGNLQQAAGGNTVECSIRFSEQAVGADFADYSFTIVQTAASANGTVNIATIEVDTVAG